MAWRLRQHPKVGFLHAPLAVQQKLSGHND
jgi:hypothetical protein